MIGQVLKGIYRLYDKVGAGGFATVYLGRNLTNNTVVAVKVLNQEYTAEPKFVARFRREAEMAQRLQHPNIVRMLDYGVEGNVHFLVMEYVEGKTLSDIIAEHGALPVETAVGIAGQICQALDAAWQAGIVHRDIKPHNIMVTPGGVVKVMDFGIARMSTLTSLTQSGMFMGTPRYLSPEMAKGEKTDIRSDLYGLGIVLYEMLTGDVPFTADSPWALIRQQIETPPPPLKSRRQGVPDWLEAVIAKALAKDPNLRFQTPAEMLAALRGAKGETPVTPVPHALPSRRSAWPIIVGSLGALLIVGIVLLLTLSSAEKPRPSPTPGPQQSSAAVSKVTNTPLATVTLAPTRTPTPTDTETPLPPTPSSTPTPPATSPTVIVLVVTATPTPTIEPSPTPTPIPSPQHTPQRTKTPTPTAAPTAASTAPLPPTAAPPPAGLTGRIAFSVVEPGSGKHILYSINADGSDLRYLGDYLHQPSYRHDGKEIVANGEGGGMNDLWKVRPDGGGLIGSFGQPVDEHPVWLQARKGYHVGFDSPRQGDGQWRIYLGDAAIMYGVGGAIRGRYPVGLPGESVAYAGCNYGFGSGSNCGLFKVSMWGGTPVQLTGDPNDIPTGGGDPGVLFMRQVDGNWDVYLVGSGGGNAQRLTDHAANDGLATFSPDGRAIAFLSNRSGAWAIWLMGRDGSNQRKLFDLPWGGGYGPNWTSERISWGPLPAAPTPAPTEVGGNLLPAPQILFPIPDDVVSARRATTVRWTWNQQLAANQGFEVRFWHTTDPAPLGVAPPTTAMELTINFGLTEAYRQHGEGTYYLDVVVVQISPYQVLSRSARVRVKADPNK